MTKLLRHLILEGAHHAGSYEPSKVLPHIEEHLTIGEYCTLEEFLAWCVKNGRTFGHGNIDRVFHDFKKAAVVALSVPIPNHR